MAYSVEFRRLRAGHPGAVDAIDFYAFTALSRGTQLVEAGAAAALAARQARAGEAGDNHLPDLRRAEARAGLNAAGSAGTRQSV